LSSVCERASRFGGGTIPRMNLTRGSLGIVKSYRHAFCPFNVFEIVSRNASPTFLQLGIRTQSVIVLRAIMGLLMRRRTGLGYTRRRAIRVARPEPGRARTQAHHPLLGQLSRPRARRGSSSSSPA
jgi:hypothetical protein